MSEKQKREEEKEGRRREKRKGRKKGGRREGGRRRKEEREEQKGRRMVFITPSSRHRKVRLYRRSGTANISRANKRGQSTCGGSCA